jgi:hypothetical protein
MKGKVRKQMITEERERKGNDNEGRESKERNWKDW